MEIFISKFSEKFLVSRPIESYSLNTKIWIKIKNKVYLYTFNFYSEISFDISGIKRDILDDTQYNHILEYTQ